MRFRPSSADCWFPRPGSVSPSSFAFIIASQHFSLNAFTTRLLRESGACPPRTLVRHGPALLLTAATWASRSTGLRRPYRHGSLCRCRGCWPLSGLGRLLCGVSRSSCLNSTSPRAPITWEAYASAAGPALSASPRFLTWHTALSQGDPPAQAERYRRDFGPMLDRAIRKYLHHGRVQPQRYALRNSLSLKPLEDAYGHQKATQGRAPKCSQPTLQQCQAAGARQ